MASRQPPRPVRRGREGVLRRRYAIQAGEENLLRHARCHRPTATHTRWNEGVLLTASHGIRYLAPHAEVKRGGVDSRASARDARTSSCRNAPASLRHPFADPVPQFSPDGRWPVYISDESGRFEIYVQPYPGAGGKWQISTEGGTEPVWNPNGRELFYRSGNKMMAADIATQPNFAAGKPRVLFEGRYEPSPATF